MPWINGRHVGLLEEDVLYSTLSVPAKLLFVIRNYYSGISPQPGLRLYAAKMGCSRQAVHYYMKELLAWERTGEVRRGWDMERQERNLTKCADEGLEPFNPLNTVKDSDKESEKIRSLNPYPLLPTSESSYCVNPLNGAK